MSHGDFVRHNSGIWPFTAVPTWADIGQMDVNAAQLVSGDAGGTWNPAKPIIIGGAPGGAGQACLVAQASGCTGGVATARGGRLQLAPALWPALAAPVTRTVLVDLVRACGVQASGGNVLSVSTSPMGVQVTGSNAALISIPKRYMHHGALLTKIQLNMVITNLGQGLPAYGPGFGFNIVNADGSAQALSVASLRPWFPGRVIAPFTVGFCTPTAANDTGFVYYVTPGTGGGAEPVWPTAIGSTAFDGSSTVTAIDSSGHMAQASLANTYGSRNASVKTLVGMSFGQCLTGLYTGASWAYQGSNGLVVDTTQNEYSITLNVDSLPTPDVVFTSLLLTYSVSNLQTE